MEYWKLFAEVIGFAASGLFLFASGLKDDSKLSFYYTLGCIVLALHLFMLEAYAGGLATTLSACRNIAAKKDKTGIIKNIFMVVFLGMFAYYCFNHDHWSDILVPLASVVMSVGFIYLKGNGLTACMILSCMLWLVYGLFIGSHSIIFLEVATILSSSVRIVKQNNLIPAMKKKMSRVRV